MHPSFACFYFFFFHALAFFLKHPRFQTDKIFYYFYVAFQINGEYLCFINYLISIT